MPEFFNMNGYGLYVWGAYACAFIILAALVISTFARRCALKKRERELANDT